MSIAEISRSQSNNIEASSFTSELNTKVGFRRSTHAKRLLSRFYYTIGPYNILLEKDAKVENLENLTINIIPHAPDWCSGIVNVRGIIIPVVDMHTVLKTEIEQPLRKSKQILVEQKNLAPIIFTIDKLPEMISLEDYETIKLKEDAPLWQQKGFMNESNTIFEVNHTDLLNQLNN